MNLSSIKVSYNSIVLLGIALILTTFLRISLLLIAPFLILFILLHFNFTFRKYILPLFGIIFLSFLLSLTSGFYIKYNLLSFYYVMPFLLFVFSKPKYFLPPENLFKVFIRICTSITIVSDLIGFIQYIRFPNDDSFSGLYGHFTVTQNGLMIINAILLYYYILHFKTYKKRSSLIFAGFFGICCVMGFYGGGLIALIATLIVQSFRFNVIKLLKNALIALLITFTVGIVIFYIRPDTFRYNLVILNRFTAKTGEPVPRKLLSYSNYIKGYTSNIKDLVFGSGPGTFNSRSAFIIGSPEYFKIPGIFKSSEKPYYFENYAYTLWNAGNTGKYQDGFMNQPFSSVLAFLGEYGLLFTVVFFIYYFKQYKRVGRYEVSTREGLLAKDTYKFVSIFLLFLLTIDNYTEYPEITILLLLIMKLAEMELIKSYTEKFLKHAE